MTLFGIDTPRITPLAARVSFKLKQYIASAGHESLILGVAPYLPTKATHLMADGYVTVDADSAPQSVSQYLREVGCVLAKGVIAPSVIARIAEYVYGEVAYHEAIFHDALGFKWGDSGRLAAFLGSDPARSTAYETLSPEMQHLVRGELPLSVRISPVLKAIAHEPALMEFVRTCIGDPVVRLHHPPSVRSGWPGATRSLVPPHQDASYAWHLSEFLTVWVPLCSIDQDCGGIEILPGSHKLAPIAHRQRAIWQDLDLKEKRRDLVPISCVPGDAILFGPQLLHGSRLNTSGRVRCSIDYRFFSHLHDTPKHYYDVEARVVRPGSPLRQQIR